MKNKMRNKSIWWQVGQQMNSTFEEDKMFKKEQQVEDPYGLQKEFTMLP